MKKILILIGIWMLIFTACSNQEGSYDSSISKKDTITFSLNGNLNNERLQNFIDNVDASKNDKVNIVNYTTEGDPIITQLNYNCRDIVIAIDSSKDKFGGQDKNKILYNTINGGKQLKDNLLKYLVDNHFYKP